MKRLLTTWLLFTWLCLPATLCPAGAQELNARVTVNGDKVQGKTQLFATLQNALSEFINNRRWTEAVFAPGERIECTFAILVNKQEENTFRAEIQVQASRPVYNSGYMTPLLNFRDAQFDFQYAEFEPLEYTENTISGNLTATLIFYVYLILGLDFDSFSPSGGTAFLEQARQVVTLAQGEMSWNGWKAFDNDRNRHALITAFTDNTSSLFRQMWYSYHRKGLDEMSANADRGRTSLLQSLSALGEIKAARPSSLLLQYFSDTKLDEVASIYSKATASEKQEGLTFLSGLFPAQQQRLSPLKE
jgi:hypothetical protein